MGPSKQSVLPIGMFMKNPKLSTKKKHSKLEKKALGVYTKRKPFVDKKKEQRLKDEKEIADGADGWRRHLQRAGDADADTFRTDIMYQAYGPAPDPHTGHYSNDHQDENHVDFPEPMQTIVDEQIE